MTSVILVVLLFHIYICDGLDREKRQIMFPPQSIMQLAFAVVTPAQVKNRLITTNMGIMFNIDLPTNISIWYPWRADYRRKRSTEQANNCNQAFYNLLQTVLSLNGLDGKACLQKSVCQMKKMPLHNNDIPHQILNVVFGFGHKHTDMFWDMRHDNISCDVAYPACHYTPVDIFIELFTSSWN